MLSLFPKAGKEQGKMLWNSFFILLLLGLIAGSSLYFFQDFLIQQLTKFEKLAHIELISLFLIFNAPAALIEYIYLLQKRESRILPYGICIFSLQLLAIIIPLVFDWGIAGIFKCLLVWSIFKFCWLLKILDFSLFFSSINQWGLQKKLLRSIFPLSLHMLLGGGMEYIDGFIVTSYFESESQFAIFRYGARELPLVTILTAALTATLIPLAVEKPNQVIKDIKLEINRLARWLYPLTYFLMLISPFLFPLVYNADFAESAQVFNIYLLIISSRLLLPQVFIYAQQKNFILVWSAIIEIVINLNLSLLLVKYYGLAGIAFATVIAYLINKIILIAYVQLKMNIPLSQYLNIKSYLFFNALLIICYLLSNQLI
jgi:O-antigen/teichoic acid export membrane protein